MSDESDLIPLSRTTKRLLNSAVEVGETPADELVYQHTVFCQTCLPYRDPGDEIRIWEKEQGRVALSLEAGRIRNSDTDQWVELGLPFGSKARLVLMHLNSQAIKNQSPMVDVEDSMTAFVRRILGWEPNGREIGVMKDQLSRLAAAMIRLATSLSHNRVFQVNTQIVTAIDLWFPKDERRRVVWPSTVRLSQEYFESLVQHAVPLDERAIAALAHSAMALDIYVWLAQRMHRVEEGQPQFISWKALKDQFGSNYGRMIDFRRVFLEAFNQAHSQYRAARVEIDRNGMTLRHSLPPIKGRIFALKANSKKKIGRKLPPCG